MKWLIWIKRKYQQNQIEKREKAKQTFILAVLGSYSRIYQKSPLRESFKPYLKNLEIENSHYLFLIFNSLTLEQIKFIWGKNFKKILSLDEEIRFPQYTEQDLIGRSMKKEYQLWRLDHLVLEPIKEYPLDLIKDWADSNSFKVFLETGKIEKYNDNSGI